MKIGESASQREVYHGFDEIPGFMPQTHSITSVRVAYAKLRYAEHEKSR
jgi:hypothetical protein